MRALMLVVLVLAAALAQAKSPAEFGPSQNYQSTEGRLRLLAFKLTGAWHDVAESRLIVLDILPPAYSAKTQFMSKEGHAKLVAAGNSKGAWLESDEAVSVAGQIYADKLFKLPVAPPKKK